MHLEAKMFVGHFSKKLDLGKWSSRIPRPVFPPHHLDHINQCSGVLRPELMSPLSVISFPSVLTQSPISQHSFNNHMPPMCLA